MRYINLRLTYLLTYLPRTCAKFQPNLFSSFGGDASKHAHIHTYTQKDKQQT